MNLRGIANSISSQVNPNIEVTLRRSTGYTIGRGGRQDPGYDDGLTGIGQMQALDGSTLRHLAGLNIQGVLKFLYMYGKLAGVIRPDSKGGDIVMIGDETWLVVLVKESWPEWTRVVIQYQNGAPDA